MSIGNKLLYYFEKSNISSRDRYINILNVFQEFSTTSVNKSVFLRDRTETYKGKYNQINEHPFEVKYTQNSLEDICNRRAEEILAKCDRVNLCWSGGIDSTGALVSFLKIDPKKVNVIFEPRSILENQNFFKKFIKDKVDYEILGYHYARYRAKDNELIITGDTDCIWNREYGSIDLSLPWEEYVLNFPEHNKHYKNNKFMEKEHVRKWAYDHLKEFIKLSPNKIETALHLKWWICLTVKWDFGLSRIKKFFKKGKDQLKKWDGFYNDQEFCHWALTHYDGGLLNTKEPLKRIIYEYDHNKIYYDHKVHQASAYHKYSFDPIFKAMPFSELYNKDYIVVLVDNLYNEYTISDLSNDNISHFYNEINDKEWISYDKKGF